MAVVFLMSSYISSLIYRTVLQFGILTNFTVDSPSKLICDFGNIIENKKEIAQMRTEVGIIYNSRSSC